MPRRARLKVSGQPWHVWQRGVNRARCFSGVADRERYLGLLAEKSAECDCQVHAYVLMSNHVHLLVTPAADDSVSRMMKAVGERYVRAFNKRHKRTGTLWEGRFKSTIVDSERYLFTLYRYIELNPVRAGLVEHPREFPWSSHGANAFGERDSLVSPHEVYRKLGRNNATRRAAYRGLFNVPLDETTVTTIRHATQKGWALGSKKFRQEIAALVGRRAEALRVWQSDGIAEREG